MANLRSSFSAKSPFRVNVIACDLDSEGAAGEPNLHNSGSTMSAGRNEKVVSGKPSGVARAPVVVLT